MKCIAEANRALMRFHDPQEAERLEPNSFWENWQARQTGHSYRLLHIDNLGALDQMLLEFVAWAGGDDLGAWLTKEDEDLQPLSDEEANERLERGAKTITERAFDIASVVTVGAPTRAGASASASGSLAAGGGGARTFEIFDGVRRAKAAELAGRTSIRAEVEVGGRVVETLDVPLESLRSPFKSAIDVSSSTRQFQRFERIMQGTQRGDPLPPIRVQPRGPSIFDIFFE